MAASDDRAAIIRLVDQLNTAHGLRFDVRGRCANGLQGGAWILADTGSKLGVLKTCRADPSCDIHRIAEAVARVRETGYPTPAWLASGTGVDGTAYWVQDYVAGQSATPLVPSTVAKLVAVLECQAGLDPLPDRGWGRRIAEMALSDDLGSYRRTVRDMGPAASSAVPAKPSPDGLVWFCALLRQLSSSSGSSFTTNRRRSPPCSLDSTS